MSLSHVGILGPFVDIAPSDTNVLFTTDACYLKGPDVIAIGMGLDVSEIPVGAMLFPFMLNHPMELFIIVGVDGIQLTNCREYRRRLLSSSFN